MDKLFQSFSTAFKSIFGFIAPASSTSVRVVRITRFLAYALTAGITIGTILSPIAGYDWYTFYYKFAFDPLIDASPPWLYMIITPIAMLPHSFTWFTLLNGLLLLASIALLKKPNLLLVLCLPLIWILFYGQIDGWLVFSVLFGLWALERKRPFLVGVSVILLLTKPHIGFPLAVYFLFKARSLKTFVIPVVVFLISLVVYGFWPVVLIQSYINLPTEEFTTQKVNTSLWPWSLLLLPVIFLRWKKLGEIQKFVAITAATCLVIPYSPIYSLAPLLFLTTPTPWLSLILLPAWMSKDMAALSGSIFSLASLIFYMFVRPGKNYEVTISQP
jgi:hypothetical protein